MSKNVPEMTQDVPELSDICSELNDKQVLFVKEYLVDLNATQAAMRAGYSKRTAGKQGTRLLSHAVISKAIEIAKRERMQRVEVTHDRVLEELCRMGFYDPKDIAGANVRCPEDIANLPENVRRAIVGWSWDKMGNFVLKLADKKGNLELVGKHIGMFRDKKDDDGKDGDDQITLSLQGCDGATIQINAGNKILQVKE